MELEQEELEAAASEDAILAQAAVAQASRIIQPRKRPSRRSLPEHLPRERVVIAAPQACPWCGSARLSKLGEDITETLEVVPHRWKVIQTVRERFSCGACEMIAQAPAPFHPIGRGRAGPGLLAGGGVLQVQNAHAVAPAERALRPRGRADSRRSQTLRSKSCEGEAMRPLHAWVEVCHK